MKGNKYQVECLVKDIKRIEARGEDATPLRTLLKHWSHYEGWECATEALSALGRAKSRPSKQRVNDNLPVEGK